MSESRRVGQLHVPTGTHQSPRGGLIRLRSSRPRLFGAIFAAVAWTGGCSLVFRADPAQCSKDSDCTAKGAAFADMVCEQSTCVTRRIADGGTGGHVAEAGSGGNGNGGGGGGGRASDGSAGGVPYPDGVGGEAQVPSGDASPDVSNDSGPTLPACSSNADCTPASITHSEVACDTASGTCLQLTTDECPFVIGDYSGKVAAPIYLGAFATMPPTSPQSHPSYLNFKLAIDEFDQQGVPGWDAKRQTVGLRMPVAVVCNVEADVPAAMAHLTSDLQIPGVVAIFDTLTLKSTFLNDPSGAFFVNAFSANSTLTTMATGGRLWHLLGQPSDHAPAYQAFMPRVESYVRTLKGMPAATPLRVAAVIGNATDTTDLSEAVFNILRWNDSKSVEQNRQAGYFKSVSIESVLNGADPAQVDVDAAVEDLLAFQPHIVLSFGSFEFGKLLQVYEIRNSGGLTPFYLLGPYNMGSDGIRTWIGAGVSATTDAKRARLAGIGTASTTETRVLTAYTNRFLAKYSSGESALGQENYYDAMYFAVYSLVGGGAYPKPKGSNLAEGMTRLLSGNIYDMGPSNMGAIFGALTSTGTIRLYGTLGPPDFSRVTGSRVGEGSIYCLNAAGDSGLASYAYDVLRLASATDGGAPSLTGNFSCYSGM